MKTRSWFASLLLLAAAPTCFGQTSATFSAADVKSDLAYLYTTLEQAHFNLYAYTSKPRFDRAYRRLLHSLPTDSVSALAASKVFQQLAARANTGHCEVDFPAPAYIAYAQRGGTVFPLELAFENGRAYIRKSFTDQAALQAGTQLLSINGQSIGNIQAAIHPYLSAERAYFKNAKLEFYSFPRLYWMVFGEQKSFTVQVRDAQGRASTHRVEALSIMDYETRRGGEIVGGRRSFRYVPGAAYLNPGPFASAQPEGEAQFKGFIDSVFADLRGRPATTLLLDLRNHPGGHNAYSDYLIAYFANRPFRWHSTFQLKTSAVLKQQSQPTPGGPAPDAYTQAILSHPNGAVYPYMLPPQDPVPADKRFTGRVLVLVNRHSYSMAAVSAALIQDYGFGQIVGEETGDVPTMYGSQFSFPLPKTGLVAKAPKGYFVRPNGSRKLAGVVPEYRVADHLVDQNDEILTYTLEKILTDRSR